MRFAILLTTKSRPEFAKLLALIFSAGTGAMSVYMLTQFDRGDAGFQMVSQHDWIEQWGIGWHLGVDGISLFLVVLTGILFPAGDRRHRTPTTTRSRTWRGCSCSKPV